MHKDLSGLKTADLVGRHPRVRTTDPEKVGLLNVDQSLEEVRFILEHGLCPYFVSFHNPLKVVHVGCLASKDGDFVVRDHSAQL